MISVFDTEKLQNLLQDFFALSHIRITVFDENQNELVSYPKEIAPYCAVIRETAAGYEACMLCDRAACKKAREKHGSYIYQCHAGFMEAVTPLCVGDILVGYLLFGHVFSYHDWQQGWTVIQHRCKELPINQSLLKEALMNAQPISEENVRSAAHILHAVASYLILEHMAKLQEDELAVRLDAYLSAHFTEAINAATVCKQTGIGKTQLYKLSKQLYGHGIAEHIRNMRMEKAKTLLTEKPSLSIAEISAQCGYQDYNYFIFSFSRDVGETPSNYRRNHK